MLFRSAETADMYIEKITHKIGKKHRVRVATSDNLEQIIILGNGATRLSANELLQEVKLVEIHRAVVVRGGQAESVIHQVLLAGEVAAVHSANLRERNVALVHEQQEVVREEVQQGHGGGAGGGRR